MPPHDQKAESADSRKKLSVRQAKSVLRRADAVCFDVDSTVCTDEAIDELAEYCGVGQKVKEVTNQAMNGSMTFRQALAARLKVMQPTMDDVSQFIEEHPFRLTPGIRELVNLLHERGTHVYLISGGFESIIHPVAADLNIPTENVYANRLLFTFQGRYGGFDLHAHVSESGGKTRVIEDLKSRHSYKNLVMIGDGATDLETFPTCDAFIGFGGNQCREYVREESPWYVTSFQELIDVINDHGIQQ